MEERLKVKEVFLRFVNAMESDAMDEFDDILTEDVILDATNYGSAAGIKEVKKKLKWQGMPINYARARIFNFVAFTENNYAKQSAVVATIVGMNDPDYFHYFQFSGYYLNDYVKKDDQWKISKIKFNLDMEDGNTLFVRNWWKLIDYRFYEGAFPFPIISELEAPWRAIENPESLGTEEEQVVDAYYRYCWGIDHSDMDILLSSLDDYVRLDPTVFHIPPKGELDPKTHTELLPKYDFVMIMKYKRYKEACMEHIFKIVDVKINGDKATLVTYRYEPHRIGTKKLNRLNFKDDFYSYRCDYEFTKKEDGWKMTFNKANAGANFTITTNDQNKFY